MKKSIIRFGLWAMLCGLAAGTAQAVPVRIASFNVAFGIDTSKDAGTSNDVDYIAASNTIQRIQPDIICFQELYADEDMQAWIRLAAQLGYPYYAMSSGGSLDNSMRTGIWSKYPITGTDLIKETHYDPNAVEIMRWPIVATIEVPGALYPLHVASTHNKAGTTTKSARLQRAFEMYRIVQYFDRLVASNPTENVQYAIMGDFNDDIGLTQNEYFDLAYYNSTYKSLGNSTADFNDGTDIPWNTNSSWTLPYSKYPTERLSYADMGWINPVHTGTNLTWTHYYETESGRYRLDYILFSDEIMNSAYGAPTGEIYNAEFDGEGVGLYKPGPVPPSSTSYDASDHRMLFADFHLIDVVPGITPVVILSEIVDDSSGSNANYVEINNTGSSSMDLTGYQLGVYLNGSTNPTLVALSGTLAGGATYAVAASLSAYSNTWGMAAQQAVAVIGSLDGNDTVALLKPNGSGSDVYGQIGGLRGVGLCRFGGGAQRRHQRSVRCLGFAGMDDHRRHDRGDAGLAPGAGQCGGLRVGRSGAESRHAQGDQQLCDYGGHHAQPAGVESDGHGRLSHPGRQLDGTSDDQWDRSRLVNPANAARQGNGRRAGLLRALHLRRARRRPHELVRDQLLHVPGDRFIHQSLSDVQRGPVRRQQHRHQRVLRNHRAGGHESVRLQG
jgi:endonuclease/exonuclease/phosphatase family metal-dependent hydrolase